MIQNAKRASAKIQYVKNKCDDDDDARIDELWASCLRSYAINYISAQWTGVDSTYNRRRQRTKRHKDSSWILQKQHSALY